MSRLSAAAFFGLVSLGVSSARPTRRRPACTSSISRQACLALPYPSTGGRSPRPRVCCTVQGSHLWRYGPALRANHAGLSEMMQRSCWAQRQRVGAILTDPEDEATRHNVVKLTDVPVLVVEATAPERSEIASHDRPGEDACPAVAFTATYTRADSARGRRP